MAKASDQKPNMSQAPPRRVFPMQLRPGDLLSDERAEWRVVGRPYSTAGGKTVNVRVESVKNPGVFEVRAWGAHERVAVRRTGVA